MAKAYWGEIKDPVHGYVYITENEKEIIDTYPMQRLRRLRQLQNTCTLVLITRDLNIALASCI
jgi:hypothetical protein